MKKSMIAICGAMLASALFAEGPALEEQKPEGPKPEMRQRGPRAPHQRNGKRPLSIIIDEKTTDEQLAKFKADVLAKIDEAVAERNAKPAEEQKPVSVVLFVNDRGPGNFGPGRGQGMGRGPRGGDMGGRRQRGPRPDGVKPGDKPNGELPPPPQGEDAPEA